MNMPDQNESPALKPIEPLTLFEQQSFFIPPELNLVPGSLCWLGRDGDAVLYQAQSADGAPVNLSVFSLITDDEKIIFRAFQDFYAGAMRQLSEVVRGYYSFEVLQFFVGDAPRTWSEFAGLLARHAAKQAVCERRLIQFGSLWGILEKHTEADFGRVESKLKTDFYKLDSAALARRMKKFLSKETSTNRCFIFRDESRNSIIQDASGFELFRNLVRPNGSIEGGVPAFFWHPFSKRCLRI